MSQARPFQTHEEQNTLLTCHRVHEASKVSSISLRDETLGEDLDDLGGQGCPLL